MGEKIRVGIDESIRLHDKLLLLLSKNSVDSDWVEKEVETAMEKERQQKRVVLFPVRLDDAVMKVETGWPADIRRSRNIGDFKKWKTHGAYQKAFERLLRDLKAEESVGAKQY
ncbi:MAG: TIR domain-containing protein [Isosphaeraceae bacterium]